METMASITDKLIIVNLKIFKAEDVKRDETSTDTDLANATRATNVLNQQRNDLMQEMDELFLDVISGKKKMKLYKQGSTKMYGK